MKRTQDYEIRVIGKPDPKRVAEVIRMILRDMADAKKAEEVRKEVG